MCVLLYLKTFLFEKFLVNFNVSQIAVLIIFVESEFPK